MRKAENTSRYKMIYCLVALAMGSTLASAAMAAGGEGRLPDGGVHESHADEIDALYAIPDVVKASQVNEDTVGLIFSPDDIFESAVRNLDAEIEAHKGPRLIPILGKNHVQNVYDLLYLKNVDVALIHSDAIEYVKRIGNFPTVGNVIKALVNIHQGKIVILGGKGIQSVEDLEGKKVAMGYYTSGAFITGSVIMDMLDINVESVFGSVAESLEKLESGEIAGMIYLLHDEEEGAHGDHDDDEENEEGHEEEEGHDDEEHGHEAGHDDHPGLEDILAFDGAGDVSVLALSQNEILDGVYSSTEVTAQNLPLLLDEGESVASYKVNTILAAYRWRANNPRYTKTQSFVNAFLDTEEHLKTGPQGEFWNTLDMKNAIPGVDRLALVDEVMDIREVQRQAEIAAEREQAQAKLEAERLLRLEKLKSQQEVIEQLIDQRVDDADLAELESLLEELNSFVDKLDDK